MTQRLVVAMLVFVGASTLTSFALALRKGALSLELAWIGLGIGALASVVAGWQAREATARRALSPWDWAGLTAFALFALRSFCWLLYWDKDVVRIGAPNNLGDICRHLLYARMFADGEPVWPDHPLHAWEMLRYYPGADFFQAMLLSVGADELRALAWCGLAGSVLAAFALRRWGGAFTLLAFLFAGGLAGFEIFATGVVKDYQMPLAWKPLATAIFVTQRGFLFALPAGLMLLISWRARWFGGAGEGGGDAPPLPRWVEWLLLVATAFFQLYAFLFLMGLLVGWGLIRGADRTFSRDVFLTLALALALAAPLIALMTNFGAGRFFRWRPGWMWEPGGNVPWFWVLNFGLSLPLAAWLWLRLGWRSLARSARREDSAAAAFVLPAGCAFGMCALFAFAPWEWDNTKLMIWAYLAAAPYVWSALIRDWPVALRVLVCFGIFASGAVSLLGGLRSAEKGVEIARRSELDFLRVEVADLPRSVRFACAPAYNHPLVLLGRRIAMGYDGHLYGYGLEYADLRREVETLMLGGRGWRKAAARLGVTHIYWGPREAKRYAKSNRPWEQDCGEIANGDWGRIFALERQP